MQLPRPDIFISATTADLGPMREIAERAVLDLGAHPIEQEHFAPAGQTVADMLREKIAASDAVIHLVGECFGAEDETAAAAREHRSYEQGRRSYAQLEHDLARELGKPLYVFICGEHFPYAAHAPESEEKRRLQAAHRACLLGGNVLYRMVERGEELREHILRLEERLRVVGAQLQGTRSWLMRSAALLAVVLVVFGGGMFFLKQHGDTQDRRMAMIEMQTSEQMELVRAVLIKAQSPSAEGGPDSRLDALASAQIETAQERGLTLAQLREKLSAAEIAATARVRIAREARARARAQTEAANRVERAALKDLGDAALANIKYAAAVGHYREAAALYDRGKEPLEWAAAQARVGEALWRDGQYADSIATWQEVFDERARRLGADDALTIAALEQLAVARQAGGDYTGAEPLLRRALEASERVLGGEHADTLTCLTNLGALLQLKGDYAGAGLLYRRALDARERTLGKEHADTLETANNLAVLLDFQGDLAGAEQLHRSVLEASERTLGRDHPHVLSTLNNLAIVLYERGDFAGFPPLRPPAPRGRRPVEP